MIPIVAILSLFSAFLCFFIFFRLWRRSQAADSSIMRQFAFCYLFFAIFFSFFAAPGTIHTSSVLIAMDSALAYLALFIAIAYFIQIPLEILKKFYWAAIIFWLTIITGVSLFIANTIYLPISETIIDWPFIYYLIHGNTVIQGLNSFIPIVFDLIGIIFFMTQGRYLAKQARSSKVSYDEIMSVVYRSYHIAVGWMILLVAGIINFLALTSDPNPAALFWATAAAVVGLLVVFRGINITGRNLDKLNSL